MLGASIPRKADLATPLSALSSWIRPGCIGAALLVALANLAYWWVETAHNHRCNLLPMTPLTAGAFLLLAAAFATRLAFRESRWPGLLLVSLSALAVVTSTAAAISNALYGLPDWESVFDPARLTYLGAPIGRWS